MKNHARVGAEPGGGAFVAPGGGPVLLVGSMPDPATLRALRRATRKARRDAFRASQRAFEFYTACAALDRRTPRVFRTTPRPERMRDLRAELLARVQLDLLQWKRPVRRLRAYGGDDPSRPCDGCPVRRTCKAPCELLTALVPKEEPLYYHEVLSPALTMGRGRDEQFMCVPTELRDAMPSAMEHWNEEPNEEWPVLFDLFGGTRMEGAMASFTSRQREVMRAALAGRSRTEIRKGKGAPTPAGEAERLKVVSRQAIHKIWHAALGNFRDALGDAPEHAMLRAIFLACDDLERMPDADAMRAVLALCTEVGHTPTPSDLAHLFRLREQTGALPDHATLLTLLKGHAG